MKKVFTCFALSILSITCFAKGGGSSHYSSSRMTGSGYTNPSHTRVSGYTKKNGTYVASYEKSHNNSTQLDNFDTKGNVNPYTGKDGTKYASK
ncbi:hypothetical protein F975_01662 [Acinetobacter sp. ANC 3789]|nr:hypothetical protein F975_01662 [Acinetobacter sp. ANC 3789]